MKSMKMSSEQQQMHIPYTYTNTSSSRIIRGGNVSGQYNHVRIGDIPSDRTAQAQSQELSTV